MFPRSYLLLGAIAWPVVYGAYRYRARGLRAGRRYRVTFDNSGDVVEVSGLELQRDGLEIRLESPVTSELLLIETT